jgi:LuxR family transcriptional regulator, maltose regulon positive regulatory protein
MTNLKFLWLGSPSIKCDNSVIHLETRKATALLAFLSLSTASPSRESLATLFWPEFDQTHALANLRRNLFSIKQLLGPEILVSSRENVGINPDSLVWQDVSEFRLLLETVKTHQHAEIFKCPECVHDLEKAVSLYRGDFLEGLNLRDCPEFDDWQYLEREGFRTDLASTLEKLAHAYSANGEWEKAILMSRQWVSLDRLNENAQRMLIQVYALSGQRSAALRQYEECTRWQQDELGQFSEKETIALVQKIQTGEIGRSVGQSETGVIDLTARIANEPLIRLKLFVPHLRTGMVSRPHLIEKLERGTHCELTLISAPAGYGKTTLLSEWIDTRRKGRISTPWTVCWLSLDAGDNDPIRFLTYLTAALESARPGIGAEARSILQSSQSLHPATHLSMLINEVQELPQPVVLVLDDYQLISNPTIHDGVIFLLEHLPSNVHLVISTRSDPPLPLALLRGRNQLNELRAKDLRFTSAEAATFLLTVFNLSLTPEQITILENRTEGWIAGLQMAALSMQGRLDISQFIEAFSGSHRFILDYLTEEALNRQSKETQVFLLRTSILERLNSPLCDFVLDRKTNQEINIAQSIKDVSIIQCESQSLLTELELSNLFIVPLDDDRIWYRYHHLFADLLRSRLEQTSPKLLPILHMRASTWFENNGWIEESITHSLAAKDWDNISRLIDLHFHTYLENGQMATVLKWIEGLPQDVVFRYPKLCAQVAEVYSQAGMIDQIDPLLNRAEEILSAKENHMEVTEDTQGLNLSPKDITVIRSMVAILRGLKAVCSGDPQRAVNFTQTALTNFPDMEPRELAVLFWVEGWAYRSLGNLSRALESLTKATGYALKSGAILRDIWTDLGNVTRLVGKLPQAIDIITNSLQNAVDRGIQNQGNLSRDETFLSFIFLEQNQLDLAFTHATQAVAHTQWWPSHIVIAMANVSLAQICLVQGNLDGSLHAIQKADLERKNWLMTPFVHSLADVTWARIWLIQGKWNLLDQWSNNQILILNATLDEGKSIDEYLEMRLIMLVRVWMKKTKIDKNPERNEDCLRLLDRLENSSQTAGRINSLVEILFLREVIRFLQGNKNEAIDGLEKCFSMAEPGGYMRIFLDTGESARFLISAYLQKLNPIHKSYALKTLKAFSGFLQTSIPTNELLEAITPREMEVLHLLAEGYSNQQMAEKLVLAKGTIKFHVHQLLGKLQVKSRMQAIIRARDLELI